MIDQALPNALGATALVSERPFTHTDYIQKDRKTLIHMGKQVCTILETHLETLQKGFPVIIEKPDGGWHRFLIPNPKVLLNAETLYLVGFFGQKGKEKPPNYFTALDDRLIEQIPAYQGILSYSSMALPNGDFCNLVLLLDEEIKSKWLEGDTHHKAVALSPGYYRSIRIDNGFLPHGVLQYDLLQINKVKYYDYREDPPWKAIRKLDVE